MVNDAIIVEEHFFLEAFKDGQDGDGKRGGGLDEIPGVAHEDGDGEGHNGECEISQSRKCKSPRVKTRVVCSTPTLLNER